MTHTFTIRAATEDDALAAIDLMGRAGELLLERAAAVPHCRDRWWTHYLGALIALVNPTVVRRVSDLLLASAEALALNLEEEHHTERGTSTAAFWHELVLAGDVLREMDDVVAPWLAELVGQAASDDGADQPTSEETPDA